MPITATFLKTHSGRRRDKTLEKSDGRGLTVRVSPEGAVSFYLRFRIHGKPQRMKLGDWPGLSLGDARLRAAECRQKVSDGIDPRRSKCTEEVVTLDKCLDEWAERRVKRQLRGKTAANYLSQVKHLRGRWKGQPVEDITAREWIRAFDEISASADSETIGCNLLKTAKACLRWCASRFLVEEHKLDVLRLTTAAVGSTTPAVGERVLSIDEVRAILRDLERSKAAAPTRHALTFVLLMGARIGEIVTMRWEHLHGEGENMIWTVPAHLSKTNSPIRRPVPAEMRARLSELAMLYGTDGLVLSDRPCNKPDAEAVSPAAIRRFIYRLVERCGSKLNGPFTPHDARRTLSTHLSDAGVELWVTERMLGHKLRGVLAVYNKSDWLEKQREGYMLWSELLWPEKYGPGKAANVISFERNGLAAV